MGRSGDVAMIWSFGLLAKDPKGALWIADHSKAESPRGLHVHPGGLIRTQTPAPRIGGLEFGPQSAHLASFHTCSRHARTHLFKARAGYSLTGLGWYNSTVKCGRPMRPFLFDSSFLALAKQTKQLILGVGPLLPWKSIDQDGGKLCFPCRRLELEPCLINPY